MTETIEIKIDAPKLLDDRYEYTHELRYAKYDEWYAIETGEVLRCLEATPTSCQYLIVRKIKPKRWRPKVGENFYTLRIESRAFDGVNRPPDSNIFEEYSDAAEAMGIGIDEYQRILDDDNAD